jgi:hypothetical protein
MNWQMLKQILYPDIEYIEYHVLKVEQWLIGLGVLSALAFLLSAATPFYRQEQLRQPQAQQFAADVCHMLPNCADASLAVWSTGNGNLPWQMIVHIRPKDPSLVPGNLQPLQQQVRAYAHRSTFTPVREQADQLMLVIR